MTPDSKDLTDEKMPRLREIAAELGVPAPVGTTKVALIAAIQKAQPKPDPDAAAGSEPSDQDADAEVPPVDPDATESEDTSDDSADEDLTDEVAEREVPEGYVEERKPVEIINDRGDWVDPFSGLRVHHTAKVCVQSGAQRDGDEAVRLVHKAD